jgi:hypothetical protein
MTSNHIYLHLVQFAFLTVPLTNLDPTHVTIQVDQPFALVGAHATATSTELIQLVPLLGSDRNAIAAGGIAGLPYLAGMAKANQQARIDVLPACVALVVATHSTIPPDVTIVLHTGIQLPGGGFPGGPGIGN